ncbi:MAG: phosphatase PAP2 family protein [Saprospirales bacterium]|nr:phosphatase PAP2 family protein [Saprospirales bacterium]
MKDAGFALICFFLLSACALQAQPYSLEPRREAWIGAAGFALLAADLGLSSALAPLDEQAIAKLDPGAIWSVDRPAVKRFSTSADLRSDFTLAGAGLLAGLSGFLALEQKPFRNEGLVLGAIWLETNILTLGGTLFLKDAFHRTRPFVYNPDLALGPKLKKNARRSFISGHTSLSAANSFFAARVFCDYFPQSRWKPLVIGLAAALPVWTGLERYLAGQHFPSDALAGYGLGALCGWLTPRLHLLKKTRREKDHANSAFFGRKSKWMDSFGEILKSCCIFTLL